MNETEEKLPRPKLTASLEQKIESTLISHFGGSLEKLKEYFSDVARSSWLMGEESASFQANLSYLLKPEVIQRVKNKDLPLDRITSKAAIQRDYNERINGKSESFKTQLQRAQRTLSQEYDAKLESLLDTEKKEIHHQKFSAWLEYNSPGIFEDWLDLGWNTPYIENSFMEYLGQTLIKKSREQYLSEQMEFQYPHLANAFSRFVDYIQPINPRLVDSIQDYSWNSYLLDSYLRTFIGQQDEQPM